MRSQYLARQLLQRNSVDVVGAPSHHGLTVNPMHTRTHPSEGRRKKIEEVLKYIDERLAELEEEKEEVGLCCCVFSAILCACCPSCRSRE